MTTLANAPAVAPLGRVELDLLRRAYDGRLPLTATNPEIEVLYDAGLIRPHGNCWDLAKGVRLCEICGQPGDARECNDCAIAEETRWKRVSDV